MKTYQVVIEISTEKSSDEVRDAIFGYFDSYPDGMRIEQLRVRKEEEEPHDQ